MTITNPIQLDAFTVELDDNGEPIQSNTTPWLLRRQTGLGASEGPAILSMSRWQSPRDVALAKRATTISDEQTEAMEFGHLMEPIARELFRRRHGNPDSDRHRYLGDLQPSPGLIRSTRAPHLLASLDAVIVEPDGQAVPGQIKNVTAYKRDAWADSEDGVPDDVRVQVVQECIALGADHGWVLPIFGGNYMPEPIRVDADPAFVEWYLEYSAEWWQNYGPASQVLPDPTLLDDLSGIWAGIMGESVDLPAELVMKVVEHKSLGQQIKTLTEQRDQLALDVKTFMGDATEAWLNDPENPAARRLVATWRPHKAPRRTFDRAQLLADHPELGDLFEAYMVEGKTPRPFLSK